MSHTHTHTQHNQQLFIEEYVWRGIEGRESGGANVQQGCLSPGGVTHSVVTVASAAVCCMERCYDSRPESSHCKER